MRKSDQCLLDLRSLLDELDKEINSLKFQLADSIREVANLLKENKKLRDEIYELENQLWSNKSF